MRITTIGRSGKITYGTNASFSFEVKFPTYQYANIQGMNPQWGLTPTSAPIATSKPTAGIFYISGAPITLLPSDLVTPTRTAAKIASSFTTAGNLAPGNMTLFGNETQQLPLVPSSLVASLGGIPFPTGVGNGFVVISAGQIPLSPTGSGYTLGVNPYQPDTVTLTSTTVGPIAQPNFFMGSVTNVFFSDVNFVNGMLIPPAGAQDDIVLKGRTPVTVGVSWTGGNIPVVQSSIGTDVEQAQGTLVYTNVALGPLNQFTFATPVNYIRLVTQPGNTQAVLYVIR